MSKQNIGKVVQVIGPVLTSVSDGQLPELLNAIEIQRRDRKIVAEVAQHIGDNKIAAFHERHRRYGARLDAVIPAFPSPCPWAISAWAAFLTCWVRPSTISLILKNVERWPIHRPALLMRQETH